MLDGMSRVPSAVDFTPAVEIGWRLAPRSWGQGQATGAARAALQVGFDQLGIQEIIAETAESNASSRNVMERRGTTRAPGTDFDHSQIAEGQSFRRFVLHRLTRTRWLTSIRFAGAP